MTESVFDDITTLANGHIGAINALCDIKDQRLLNVLAQLKKFNITSEHIWCLFKDSCNKDLNNFIELVLGLIQRPTGCQKGSCDWTKTKEKKEVEYKNRCVAVGCNKECLGKCGDCYSVSYCSRSCQKRDREIHKKECGKVINSLKMSAPYGKQYSKTVITNAIIMNDSCFDRLWDKHSQGIKMVEFIKTGGQEHTSSQPPGGPPLV